MESTRRILPGNRNAKGKLLKSDSLDKEIKKTFPKRRSQKERLMPMLEQGARDAKTPEQRILMNKIINLASHQEFPTKLTRELFLATHHIHPVTGQAGRPTCYVIGDKEAHRVVSQKENRRRIAIRRNKVIDRYVRELSICEPRNHLSTRKIELVKKITKNFVWSNKLGTILDLPDSIEKLSMLKNLRPTILNLKKIVHSNPKAIRRARQEKELQQKPEEEDDWIVPNAESKKIEADLRKTLVKGAPMPKAVSEILVPTKCKQKKKKSVFKSVSWQDDEPHRSDDERSDDLPVKSKPTKRKATQRGGLETLVEQDPGPEKWTLVKIRRNRQVWYTMLGKYGDITLQLDVAAHGHRFVLSAPNCVTDRLPHLMKEIIICLYPVNHTNPFGKLDRLDMSPEAICYYCGRTHSTCDPNWQGLSDLDLIRGGIEPDPGPSNDSISSIESLGGEEIENFIQDEYDFEVVSNTMNFLAEVMQQVFAEKLIVVTFSYGTYAVVLQEQHVPDYEHLACDFLQYVNYGDSILNINELVPYGTPGCLAVGEHAFVPISVEAIIDLMPHFEDFLESPIDVNVLAILYPEVSDQLNGTHGEYTNEDDLSICVAIVPILIVFLLLIAFFFFLVINMPGFGLFWVFYSWLKWLFWAQLYVKTTLLVCWYTNKFVSLKRLVLYTFPFLNPWATYLQPLENVQASIKILIFMLLQMAGVEVNPGPPKTKIVKVNTMSKQNVEEIQKLKGHVDALKDISKLKAKPKICSDFDLKEDIQESSLRDHTFEWVTSNLNPFSISDWKDVSQRARNGLHCQQHIEKDPTILHFQVWCFLSVFNFVTTFLPDLTFFLFGRWVVYVPIYILRRIFQGVWWIFVEYVYLVCAWFSIDIPHIFRPYLDVVNFYQVEITTEPAIKRDRDVRPHSYANEELKLNPRFCGISVTRKLWIHCFGMCHNFKQLLYQSRFELVSANLAYTYPIDMTDLSLADCLKISMTKLPKIRNVNLTLEEMSCVPNARWYFVARLATYASQNFDLLPNFQAPTKGVLCLW